MQVIQYRAPIVRIRLCLGFAAHHKTSFECENDGFPDPTTEILTLSALLMQPLAVGCSALIFLITPETQLSALKPTMKADQGPVYWDTR